MDGSSPSARPWTCSRRWARPPRSSPTSAAAGTDPRSPSRKCHWPGEAPRPRRSCDAASTAPWADSSRIAWKPVARSRDDIGPVFRSRDAVAAGVSWRDLYALRDRGAIIELSRGLYQLADASGITNVDFVAVCGRAPGGMICLNSALAYWDLSDE